ncbi:hypothetical protein QTG56_24055 (plasmid) [Rossellomorea sp. AcN35-11]|nr:hypothetical protein [Rossellomorea aquimaris]WJV31713.1 hypothetical protein QTG56_24055 [Rossellomorea sp. AcN35-11]
MGDSANAFCIKCGGTGERHNGYFKYPCNCVRTLPFHVGEQTILKESGLEFEPKKTFTFNEIKEVYVVLHEDSDSKSINVLDVYTDEEEANSRVGFERGMTDDDVWYQSSALKLSQRNR